MEINLGNVVADVSINETSRDTQTVRYTIQNKEDFQLINGFFWELLGTFLITYGFLSAQIQLYPDANNKVISTQSGSFGVAMCVGIAAAFGLQQTGAHYNPAISINYTLEKRINLLQLVFYISGQLVGALLAGMVYYGLNSSLQPYIIVKHLEFNATLQTQFFFQEMIGTFLLGLFYNIQTHHYCRFTEDIFIIAIDFFCAILTARTLAFESGAILNPAIAIGITLDTGIFYSIFEAASILWLYIIAPICGSVANFFFFTYFYAPLYQKLLRYQAAGKVQ